MLDVHLGGECGVPYFHRFDMPYNLSQTYTGQYGRGPFTPAWYSYDHGPVHFLTYSTEYDFDAGSPQYE